MARSGAWPSCTCRSTLPTRTPIASAPVSRPAATAAAIGASRASVAVSSASRLRGAFGWRGPGCGRRSAVRRGSRGGRSRPGPGCRTGSSAAARPRRPALRSPGRAGRSASPARPAPCSASIRAEVIIPRSPTRVSSLSPNVVRTTCDGLDERGRVGGVAGEHPDRDRAARRVGEQPVLDLQRALAAVAGVAARRQRAAAALHPRRGQIEHRHRPALVVRAGAGGPARPRWRPAGRATSPSPRTPRRARLRPPPGRPQGDVVPPGQGR